MFKRIKYKKRFRNLISKEDVAKASLGDKVIIEGASGAHIHLSGYLEIGSSWTETTVLPSLLKMRENAQLFVSGKFRFYEGSMIYINQNAELHVGSGYMNNRCNISCFKRIEIGNNVVISEGVTLRDSDNHTINDGSETTQAIRIEDNVWIGLNVTILKGVTIGKGSVIAAGAVVTKSIPQNSLAGGVPAKVIKENIEWK